MATPQMIKRSVMDALRLHHDAIARHIGRQEAAGRAGGIERVFGNALDEVLRLSSTIETERPLKEIGCDIATGDRTRGQVDLVIRGRDNAVEACAEYKAVRMPRKKADALFDLGQLAADYRRMDKAQLALRSYIIVFVYGPMAEDASSEGDLWRRFHNQQFLEVETCKSRESGMGVFHSTNMTASRRLGWHSVQVEAKIPAHARVARHGKLGAIIIGVKGH